MMRKLTLADAMNVTSFLSNKLMSLAQEQVDPSGDIPSVIELLSETASSVHEDLTMDFTESDSKPTSSSTTQQSQSTKKERKSTPVPITIEVKETPSTASDSVCEEVQLFYQKLEEEFDEVDGGAAMIFPEEDLWSHKVVTSQCDAYGFPLAPIEDPPTSSDDDDDDDAEHGGGGDDGGDRSDFSNASSALLEPFRQQHRRQKSANAKLEFTDTAKEEEKPQGRRLTPPNLREVKSWGILTEAQLRRRASQNELLQSNSEGELRSSRNSNNTVGTPDSIRKRFLGQLSSSEFLSTKIIQLAEEQVARPPANASTTPLTSGGKQRRQRRRDKAAKLEGLCLLDFNGEPIDHPLSTDLFGDSAFPPQEKKSSEQQQEQQQQHHHHHQQQQEQQQQQQLQGDDDGDKWIASFPSVSTTATSFSSKDMSSVDGFEPEKFNDPFQQLSEKQVDLEAKEVLLEANEMLLEEKEVLQENKKVVSRRRRKPRRSRRSKSQ